MVPFVLGAATAATIVLGTASPARADGAGLFALPAIHVDEAAASLVLPPPPPKPKPKVMLTLAQEDEHASAELASTIERGLIPALMKLPTLGVTPVFHGWRGFELKVEGKL